MSMKQVFYIPYNNTNLIICRRVENTIVNDLRSGIICKKYAKYVARNLEVRTICTNNRKSQKLDWILFNGRIIKFGTILSETVECYHDKSHALFCMKDINKYTGNYEKFDDDGGLIVSGYLRNGRCHGVWKYYTFGKLTCQAEYLENVLHGHFMKYDEHFPGFLVEECDFVKGEKQGNYTKWYLPQEIKNSGLPSITTVSHGDNGNHGLVDISNISLTKNLRIKKITGTYLNNKVDGFWFQWNPDGTPKSMFHALCGKIDDVINW